MTVCCRAQCCSKASLSVKCRIYLGINKVFVILFKRRQLARVHGKLNTKAVHWRPVRELQTQVERDVVVFRWTEASGESPELCPPNHSYDSEQYKLDYLGAATPTAVKPPPARSRTINGNAPAFTFQHMTSPIRNITKVKNS